MRFDEIIVYFEALCKSFSGLLAVESAHSFNSVFQYAMEPFHFVVKAGS